MKKFFALLAATMFAIPAFAGEYPDISIAELKTAMANKSVAIIDVNGTNTYKNGHIPSAVDYATVKEDLASVLPKEKDGLVVAYCGSPTCSAYIKAANKAKELGYTNVKHLSAGLTGWMQAGEKTEK